MKSWIFVFFLLIVNGELMSAFGIIALSAIVLLVLIQALWKYFSQSYQISSEKIVLYRGVFQKKETDIPYERIQTIKQRQWFFFKPFDTIQLLIETAGGDSTKAEASMPAVNIGVLDMIENYRQGEQQASGSQTTDLDMEKASDSADYRVTNSQIVLFSVTDLSIIATLIAIIVFVSEFIPENWITAATSMAESIWRAGWLASLFVLLVTLIIAMGLSLIKTFIQYYDFQVTRTNKTLTIESGLFERKTQKIPLEKIQGLKIRQQPIRKILGISTVELLLAGGQESEGESGVVKKLYILPIISDNQLYSVLAQLLPEWNFKRPEISYVSHKKLWYFWRWKLLFIPLAVGLAFLNHWFAVAALVMMLVLLLLSGLNCQNQGYQIQSAHRVCIQSMEWFTKVQTFAERQKIQAFSEETSKWLFPKQIGHTSMYLKAGLAIEVMELRFIDFTDVKQLKDFYQNNY
ncbi:PH domain-containing protein [Desemzia sp. RIT804]|uniref:PH domain-containing protein n=1 Tax=Desemzia sp. RIT 804 TaxID=2810209 RepID=UPI0019512AFC|nr:PH domain-containing protein [Desemzia sp. RIT 804]MBM6614851.1 PH domain-containing protein [Desemzia sp. RIT 804]